MRNQFLALFAFLLILSADDCRARERFAVSAMGGKNITAAISYYFKSQVKSNFVFGLNVEYFPLRQLSVG